MLSHCTSFKVGYKDGHEQDQCSKHLEAKEKFVFHKFCFECYLIVCLMTQI